jgi:H+/Cl- antiporter ClcA
MSKQFYCVLGLVACILTALGSVAGAFGPTAGPYLTAGAAVGTAITTWLMRSPLNHEEK